MLCIMQILHIPTRFLNVEIQEKIEQKIQVIYFIDGLGRKKNQFLYKGVIFQRI